MMEVAIVLFFMVVSFLLGVGVTLSMLKSGVWK